ncbi:MAG: uracil-DNA glycosylase [Desulfosoma sp.]|uniref:uracil-DNA glycosylase n=1 Tax=Desulfosoma sp. TaxID=2603217 RepID=UPI004049700B
MKNAQDLQSLQSTLYGLRLWGLRDVWLPGKATAQTRPTDSRETRELQGPETGPSPARQEPAQNAAARDAQREAKTKLLKEIREDLGDCRRCPLHRGRTQIVFGEGDAVARLVFVGEGPGADEDRLGRPFVGPAGQLLNKMIRAMGWRREQVYICNVVKCRPPGNRMPLPEEIERCAPFLVRQLEAVRPLVICSLGACASQTLLGTNRPISELRQKIHVWRGIPLIATYHPAYLLRNGAKKADTWKDLQSVMELLTSFDA